MAMCFVLVVTARPVKVPCYPPLLVPCAFHRGRCPFFAFRLALSRPCASRSNTKLEMAGRLLERNKERHLRSTEEMVEPFSDLPEATGNTGELSARLEHTLWSTSVTNFRVILFPRAKRWIRFFGNARRRVFRNVTVRNETRSYLNEPKSRCNGNRRCCLSFEWGGEVELRTPKYENQKSRFFLCLEFRFSEQNGEIQPEKVTRKIARKKVGIINHLYFLAERGDSNPR